MSRTVEEMKQNLAGLVDIPEDYCCPITCEIMGDPVVAADGHSYERTAIEQWIRLGKKKSPMTGQELACKNLTPNHRLKTIIQDFQARLPQIQREQKLLQQLEEEKKERKALEERLKALELNQSPSDFSSNSVVPLQFSNPLSRRLPSPQASVATSSQSSNRAVSNDAVKQFNLGEMYRQCRGVARDYAKAFECFEKAAAQGHAQAQYELGWMYRRGEGVAEDDTKAFEWYEKAAAQGHTDAQAKLGAMYHEGRGVAQDDAKAREWYEKAAAQGDAAAQYYLGEVYQTGLYGVWKLVKARECFEKAAALGLGHAEVQYKLGWMYEEGYGMTKAFEWYEKAAGQGHLEAQYKLGEMYRQCRGVARDYAKARVWYEKAAAQGHAQAQYELGWMYRRGEGVAEDDTKAFEWYEKAAAQGHAGAQFNLGWMYHRGRGVARDRVKALECFEKAAAQGDAEAQRYLRDRLEGRIKDIKPWKIPTKFMAKELNQNPSALSSSSAAPLQFSNQLSQRLPSTQASAATCSQLLNRVISNNNADEQYNLGEMYYRGRGVIQDYAKAREWYEKASAQGHAEAQYSLGEMYREGHGLAIDYAKNYAKAGKAWEWYEKAVAQGPKPQFEDYAKARECFEKAAAQGHAGAQFNLGWMYHRGRGVIQDYAKAREWYEKAAAQGDAPAIEALQKLEVGSSSRLRF